MAWNSRSKLCFLCEWRGVQQLHDSSMSWWKTSSSCRLHKPARYVVFTRWATSWVWSIWYVPALFRRRGIWRFELVWFFFLDRRTMLSVLLSINSIKVWIQIAQSVHTRPLFSCLLPLIRLCCLVFIRVQSDQYIFMVDMFIPTKPSLLFGT